MLEILTPRAFSFWIDKRGGVALNVGTKGKYHLLNFFLFDPI